MSISQNVLLISVACRNGVLGDKPIHLACMGWLVVRIRQKGATLGVFIQSPRCLPHRMQSVVRLRLLLIPFQVAGNTVEASKIGR